MKIYYKIWVDCILKAQSKPENKDNWKLFTMVFMSMSMALNLIFLLFVLSDLGITEEIFFIQFDIFPCTKIDAFFSFFISYLLPFLTLNYFLIFYEEKHKQLVLKYEYNNGKLFMAYFLSSIGILPLYLMCAVLIVKMFQN
jgi:hypothetical protein